MLVELLRAVQNGRLLSVDITNGLPVDTSAGTRLPSAWELALLAMTAVVLAGLIALALVAVVHARAPESTFLQPVTAITTPGGM
jgi:hypothetical protein